MVHLIDQKGLVMRMKLNRRQALARAAMEGLEARRLLSSGALDPGFGTFGKVTTDIGNSIDSGFDMAIQGDGKIVVAGPTFGAGGGDFSVVRYNVDGTLDSTFGAGGKVTTDFNGRNDIAYAVAIDGNGKIVVVGASSQSSDSDLALARYNTNGTLDSSFGTGGQVRTDMFSGSQDQALDVAIQSADNKIVVGGSTGLPNSQDLLFALARYNTNGSLDGGFGVGGLVTTNYDIGADVVSRLAIQSDGKIVAAGTNPINFLNNNGVLTPQESKFALARYATDGALDGSFGTGGKVTTSFATGFDEAKGVAIQSDGKIVVAGSAVIGDNRDFAAARYNTNGTLDSSFNGTGLQRVDFAIRNDTALGVAMEGDKIVMVGSTASATLTFDVNLAIARLNANGSIDTTFGRRGRIGTDFLGGRDTAAAVAIDGNGNIVVAGTAAPINSLVSDFAVSRYLGADIPQAPIYVVGPEAGTPPDVRVIDANTGQTSNEFFAFDQGFLGGVRVASADVNGDGVLDVILGAGPGGATNVKVIDGRTNLAMAGPLGSFLAFPGNGDPADSSSNFYALAFQGGMNFATGDVNGDGLDDIIVSVEAGGPPHVKVFSGANGLVIRSFLAFPGAGGSVQDTTSAYWTDAFQGGVRLGVGDINGDGRTDILAAAGPGAGPHVKVFSGVDTALIRSYFAYDPGYAGGVRIAAGDWNGDGIADVMTAAGVGVGPHVKVIDGASSVELASFFAYDQGFLGGVRLASGDINGDGLADLVTIPGAGGPPEVKLFAGNSGFTPTVLQDFFAYDQNYLGGAYIAVGQLS